MNSRDLIKLIEADGWIRGSHWQFKHPVKKGRVTVPHPEKDLSKGTLNSVMKQAGLK